VSRPLQPRPSRHELRTDPLSFPGRDTTSAYGSYPWDVSHVGINKNWPSTHQLTLNATKKYSVEELLVLDLLASEGMQSTLRTFDWMFEEEPELKQEMLAHLKVSSILRPRARLSLLVFERLVADSPSNPSWLLLYRRPLLPLCRTPSEARGVFHIEVQGINERRSRESARRRLGALDSGIAWAQVAFNIVHSLSIIHRDSESLLHPPQVIESRKIGNLRGSSQWPSPRKRTSRVTWCHGWSGG